MFERTCSQWLGHALLRCLSRSMRLAQHWSHVPSHVPSPCPVPCPNTERATWARRAGPSAEPSQELFQPQGLCRACVFRPLASLHILYTFQQVSHCFVVEGVVLMIHGTQLFHNVRNALSCALELVGLLFFFCCSSSLSCDLWCLVPKASFCQLQLLLLEQGFGVFTVILYQPVPYSHPVSWRFNSIFPRSFPDLPVFARYTEMMMLPILPLGLFRCLACALLDLILGYYQGRLASGARS